MENWAGTFRLTSSPSFILLGRIREEKEEWEQERERKESLVSARSHKLLLHHKSEDSFHC